MVTLPDISFIQKSSIYVVYEWNKIQSRGSTCGALTKLQAGQLRNWGSVPNWGKRLISSPKHPEWFWGPPNLQLNG